MYKNIPWSCLSFVCWDIYRLCNDGNTYKEFLWKQNHTEFVYVYYVLNHQSNATPVYRYKPYFSESLNLHGGYNHCIQWFRSRQPLAMRCYVSIKYRGLNEIWLLLFRHSTVLFHKGLFTPMFYRQTAWNRGFQDRPLRCPCGLVFTDTWVASRDQSNCSLTKDRLVIENSEDFMRSGLGDTK